MSNPKFAQNQKRYMIEPPPMYKGDLYIRIVPHEDLQYKTKHHSKGINTSPSKRNQD